MSETKNAVERRTVLKGAAWSVPVIAAAAAAPFAAASVTNASVAWTASSTSLIQLRLLDTQDVLTAKVLTTVPTEFTITNGAGAITGTPIVSINVGRPGGINLTAGPARGFGVYSVNNVVTQASERSVTYQSGLLGDYGFPLTSWAAPRAFSIPSNGSVKVPVELALAGKSGLLSISALASFPVTLTVDFGNGNKYTATSAVSVPVGAGLL
ncbi:hypothetical protein [Microbacterium sp.]|uniref:hypothetical protein n=1 Tax=Microbacterium sp. TaxID=51671 RepID=UPI0033427670